MITVAFASYKGGVGRTQCLASVAVQLAKGGSRVGLVDLDFEAPGLHEVMEVDVSRRKSMVDVIAEERPATISKVEVEIPLKQFYRGKTNGTLRILPGHCDDAERLDAVRWSHGQVDALRTSVDQWQRANALDFVLMDTRAGISGAFGAALSVCDLAALVFRPNRQNTHGVSWMLKGVQDKGKSRLLIASPVPNGSDAIGALVTKALAGCAQAWGVTTGEIIQIPYVPELALEERVPVTASGAFAPAVRGYQKVAAQLRSEARV